MPSHLRIQSNFEPFSAETTRSYFPSSPSSPPAKKQKMSLSQTYYIAASARTKLTNEAQKSDHDLRLLVGHANLLDSLMLELADAEREQEAWFNKTVNKASRSEERHIQWVDTIDEEVMEDDDEDVSDSESDSEYDDEAEDFDMIPPLRRIPSPPVRITTTELEDEDDEYEDDDEDDEDEYYEDEEFDDAHALTRSPSQQQQPPELVHEEDSDSDDDATPTTPPQPPLKYTEKERQAIATTTYYDRKERPLSAPEQEAFIQEGFFIPQRTAPLIATC